RSTASSPPPPHTLSLHDALPIFALGFPLDLVLAEAPAQVLGRLVVRPAAAEHKNVPKTAPEHGRILFAVCTFQLRGRLDAGDDSDRKSTRLNSSHLGISYAVFCL